MAGDIIKAREHFFNVKYVGNSQGQKVGQRLPFTNNGTISKSLIFDVGDSAYLTRTPSSSGSGTTFTVSFWFRLGKINQSSDLFSNSPSGSAANIFYITHYNDNTILIHGFNSGGSFSLNLATNSTFEDTTKWYHLVCAVDTTQGTSTNRVKLYIDGTQITSFSSTTYPGQNDNFGTNQSGVPQQFGRYNYDGTRLYDGYAAEINMVDGTALTPDTFGVTDTTTGRWIPKNLTGITYGTNGFRLQFANSAGQTIGDDTSGNGNDFTATNLAVADLNTNTPTNDIAVMVNYNPTKVQTITKGNLKTATTGTNKGFPVMSTLAPSSGKWYAEVRNSGTTGGNTYALGVYILEDMAFYDNVNNFYPGGQRNNGDGCGAGLWLVSGGTNYINTSGDGAYVTSSNPTYTLGAGDVIGIAADRDNDLITFYGNDGNAIGSTLIPPGRICFTAMTNTSLTFDWNFGQNGTFNGNETAGGETDENGEGDFYHSVPSGFKMLKHSNLSATDQNIDNGPTPPIPDLCWIKNRTDGTADSHQWYDSSRGPLLDLNPDATNAESTTNDGLQKFVAGGCQIEDDVSINTADENYISWNWVANNANTDTNTDGETTSVVQVNSTAKFSIGTYTSKSAEQTIGHGLGVAPDVIMMKCRSVASNWFVYHKQINLSDAEYLHLNATDAKQNGSDFGNDVPTSTTFNANATGVADRTFVFYAWKAVPGFSNFGIYHGNGNADGPFIYTGFKPAMVMQKSTSAGTNWEIRDNLRGYTPTVGHNGITGNPITQVLYPNDLDHEYTTDNCDFLSNGFKWRSSGGNRNDSGKSYVYMAWAVHPFNGDGENAFATAF